MAEPYLDLLEKKIDGLGCLIESDILLETRHFFSGAALYANGKICASLTPVGFGLKLPVEIRDRLIEAGKGSGLKYFEKAPIKKDYVLLSESTVGNPDELGSLLELSIAYVLLR